MLLQLKEKYIGDAAFYKRYLCLALPMILQMPLRIWSVFLTILWSVN